MKPLIKLFLIAVVIFSPAAIRTVQAQEDVSFQVFYDELGDHGSWIETDEYGYCWQPEVEDPEWRPYSEGYWVDTEDGWTWMSDEPWGWATYHYGRWVNLDEAGWVWVPGYEWAPAWVSWRYGDEYCGWAPLPPESFADVEYSSGGGLSIGLFFIGNDCDRRYRIGSGCYNFIRIRYLGERNYRQHYLRHRDNDRWVGRTRNVTNIGVDKGREGRRRVFARGPSLQQVNALSQTPVPHRRLVRSTQGGKHSARVEGDAVKVYAPRFNPETKKVRPPRIARKFEKTQVNRGNDLNRPLKARRDFGPAGSSAEKSQPAVGAPGITKESEKASTPRTPSKRSFKRSVEPTQEPGASSGPDSPASVSAKKETVAPSVSDSSEVKKQERPRRYRPRLKESTSEPAPPSSGSKLAPASSSGSESSSAQKTKPRTQYQRPRPERFQGNGNSSQNQKYQKPQQNTPSQNAAQPQQQEKSSNHNWQDGRSGGKRNWH